MQREELSPFECRWSRATHAVHGTTFESDGLCHVRNATFIHPLDLSSALQILAPLGQRGEFQNDNALGVPPKIDRGTYTPKPPKHRTPTASEVAPCGHTQPCGRRSHDGPPALGSSACGVLGVHGKPRLAAMWAMSFYQSAEACRKSAGRS